MFGRCGVYEHRPSICRLFGRGLHSIPFKLLTHECVLELLKFSSDVNECKPLLFGFAGGLDKRGEPRLSACKHMPGAAEVGERIKAAGAEADAGLAGLGAAAARGGDISRAGTAAAAAASAAAAAAAPAAATHDAAAAEQDLNLAQMMPVMAYARGRVLSASDGRAEAATLVPINEATVAALRRELMLRHYEEGEE